MSFEDAATRIVEHPRDLARGEHGQHVDKIFSPIPGRSDGRDAIGRFACHDPAEVVGLQLIIGLLGSECLAVLGASLASDSPRHIGSREQIAFVRGVDHDAGAHVVSLAVLVDERERLDAPQLAIHHGLDQDTLELPLGPERERLTLREQLLEHQQVDLRLGECPSKGREHLRRIGAVLSAVMRLDTPREVEIRAV